ncbi:MAG: hypothetical protein HY054_16325 [Proteobacteria bacterium]|nr:hypothetical protein [Pseudomonadota bacterium]
MQDARSESLPATLRPTLFALNELLFDLLYVAQSYYGLDLESLAIHLCVNDATMKPFMSLDAAEIPSVPSLPEQMRGSISRRAVSEVTGLPRETVRRKVQAMVDRGLIIVDEKDQLRTPPLLAEPAAQRAIESGRAAVLRCLQRLRECRAV